MNGLGYLIWQISQITAEQVITACTATGARWISVKASNGVQKSNTSGGNDQALLAWINAVRAAGIDVGGWGYVYPQNPGPQGGLATERIQKLQLSHWLIDAEGEWKLPGLRREAQLYCDSLDVNRNYHVSLCSYRYPTLHPPFPFSAFMNHDKVKSATPQVYWIGAHNAGVQTTRSIAEYTAINDDKPVIPIGALFSQGLPGEPGYWIPTVDDLAAFNAACAGTPGRGYYKLEWALTRPDLLAAAGGAPVQPPPVGGQQVRVEIDRLNFRNAPVVSGITDAGDLHKNARLTVVEDQGNWLKVEGYVWKNGTRPV